MDSIDTGLQESAPGRLGLIPDRSRKLKDLRPRKYRDPRFSARFYTRLVAGRRANGLLEVFCRSSCGQRSIDPIGRNGKNEFLCGTCADGSGICAG